jgi:hypothetical protein
VFVFVDLHASPLPVFVDLRALPLPMFVNIRRLSTMPTRRRY